MVYFFRAYPGRSAVLVALLIVSGLAEGIGFFTLLPMLEIASKNGGAAPSAITAALIHVFDGIGLKATLGTMLVVISAAMVLKAAFMWLAMRQVGYTVAHIATDLRLRLIRALMHASWSHFVSQPTGHYAATISSEAHTTSSAYREACSALAGVIRILAYLGVAILVSWQIAVAALVLAVFMLVVLRGFVRMSREAGAEQVQVMRALVGRLTQALPGIKPVKAMARERFLLPMLERETRGFNAAQQKQVLASESLRAFQEPTLVIVIALGLYSVVVFGSQPFAGVLVLALLFYRLVGTVSQLQSQYQTMTAGESAFASIRGHIELAEAQREAARGELPAPTLEREIRFADVSFRYGETPVLEGVSFTVPAGSFAAFLGPSGSGKTTILDLAVGLYLPDQGEILVDGVLLRDVAMEQWRSRIGYVPQEMVLFHGTIMENVAMGNDRITREEVRRALADAGAADFVAGHPDGMDRTVGEGGSMLSGGQRQRIAIARALVGAPRLLILDEATTALDPETEAEICTTLVALRGRVTIIAVSHQAALREVADQVFEVDGGIVTAIRGERADPVETGPGLD